MPHQGVAESRQRHRCSSAQAKLGKRQLLVSGIDLGSELFSNSTDSHACAYQAATRRLRESLGQGSELGDCRGWSRSEVGGGAWFGYDKGVRVESACHGVWSARDWAIMPERKRSGRG